MATATELRKQVAGLQQQVEKLITDINALRVKDHALFDRQEKQISDLKELARDFMALLEDDELMIEDSSDGWYEREREALATAKQLLGEEQ